MMASLRVVATVGLALAALASPPLASSAPASPAPAEPATILACDTLVKLRVLMAAGDRSAAEAALPGHPGCRAIERARIGAAEHRAMIGGAPFECLAVTGEPACAWVWP